MEKKKLIFELIIVAAILLFWGSVWGNTFVGPFNFIDEGQFGAWVNHLAHGKKLFKDIYIVYGPLSVYLLLFLSNIFGLSIFLIRIYLVLGSLFGLIGIGLFAVKLKLSRFLRYLLYATFLFLPILTIRQGFYILALYFLTNSYSKSFGWRFITGAFIVIALLISQEYGILLFLMAGIYFMLNGLSGKFKFRNVLEVLSGSLVAFGIFALLSYLDGWFFDYLIGTFDVLSTFSGQRTANGMNFPYLFGIAEYPVDIMNLLKFFVDTNKMYYYSLLIYIFTIEYLLIKLIKKKISQRDIVIFYITFTGILILPSLIARPGIANFYGLGWPVIIILIYFIQKFINNLSKRKLKTSAKIYTSILLILCVMYILRLLSIYRPNLHIRFNQILQIPNVIMRNINNERIGPIDIGSEQLRQINFMEKIVDRHSNKGDYVFFFSDQPMYYMLFDRLNPTRYDLPFAANFIAKRYEVLNDLKEKSPKLIVIDRNVWAVDGITTSERLPEVVSFIEDNYLKKYYEEENIVVYIKK